MRRPHMTIKRCFVKRFSSSLMQLSLFSLLWLITQPQAQALATDTFEFSLNELHFVIDKASGNILSLSSPKVGTFLEASPERGSIIDLAFPIKEFQPLRLAARYSKDVKIDVEKESVTLFWEALGASRPLPISGKVSAVIRFAAAADGESVIMSCTIKNQTTDSIRQVMFPDFMGIIPFAGEENTLFRTAAFVENLFELLKPKAENVPFYAIGPFRKGNGWIEYSGGKYNFFSKTPANWVDIGSLAGGISVFPRRWGPDEPNSAIMVHRLESDGKLRFLYAHNGSIAPGVNWTSDEYCFTPHRYGWAEGIKPLRNWVKQHWRRKYPIPEHVKDGMGFRSVWLAKGIPSDPQDVIYRYRDLPRLAQESIEHGLDEMVVWFWSPAFQLPMETIPALGTKQELIDAVAECRRLGVNINLFISVLYLANPTAGHYGLKPVKEMSWTYHPELIPIFNPPYANWNWTALADQANLQWQKDVLASCKEWIDCGLTSIVWDVFTAAATRPNLYDLAGRIRDLAIQRNPQSVFAGEGRFDIATESEYLDYTWNWNWYDYEDFRPYNLVFPAPRLNTNIDESAKSVKLCFADNTYMNIMPSPPDGINASDWIVNHPELSQALKQCARLRKQFLSYFREGRPIGDCILAKECNTAHVSAFLHNGQVLMIIVKTDGVGPVTFTAHLQHWLSSPSDKYVVRIYGEDGGLVGTREFRGTHYAETTNELKDLAISLYEFSRK